MCSSAITSDTAKRPPGRSTRAASASTFGLSPESFFAPGRRRERLDGGVRRPRGPALLRRLPARSVRPRSRQSRAPRRLSASPATRDDNVISSTDPAGSAAPMPFEMLLVVWPREVVVAGGARSEVACAGPGRTLSVGIQASSGIDCRRQPAADAVVTEFAALARCVGAFGVGHGPQPSVPRWIRGAGGGDARRAIRHGGRAAASRLATPVEIEERPRSGNRYRLRSSPRGAVALSVAVGLRLRMLAAGPAHLLDSTPIQRACVSGPRT